MKKLLFLFFSITIFSYEKVLIKQIIFKGNKEIPDNILIKDLKGKVGSDFSIEKLNEDYKILMNSKYIENLNISTHVERGQLVLIFEVVEKDNIKKLLKEDRIYSLSDFKDKKVPGIIKEIYIEGLFFTDKESLSREIYLKKGDFFSEDDLNISKNNIESMGIFNKVDSSYVKDGNDIYITFVLNENVVLKKDSKILNSTVFDEKELLNLLKSKKGDILNLKTLKKDIENIQKAYRDKDYSYLDINYYIEKDGLVINLNEAKIGKVSFKRQSIKGDDLEGSGLKTKDHVLRREISLKENDFLRNSDLDRAISRIKRLSYFSSIVPEVIESDDNKRDIIFRLIEEKGGLTINGGLSGTIENIGLKFNFSNNNLFGLAQVIKLGYEYEFGSSWKGYLSFYDPYIYGTKGLSVGLDLYKFHSSSSSNNIDTNSTSRYLGNDVYTGVSLKLGHRFLDNITASLKEDIRSVNHLDRLNQILDIYLENTISFIAELNNTDNFEYPSKGLFTSLNLSYTLRIKSRNVEYSGFNYKPNILSLELGNCLYLPLIFSNNVSAIRINLGLAKFVNADGPFFEKRFTLGGNSTLRGYESHSIIGMKYILINLENRITIYSGPPIVELALFMDIGTSVEELEEFLTMKNYKKSVGTSLRLKNFPLPLALNFSLPLDEKEKYIRTDINLEYTFK